METKDLMTNDLVLYRGNPLRIFEIDDFSEFVNKETEGFVGYCGETNIHISELKPIPLTDEILKKNFERYNDRYYLGGSWKLQEYGEGKYEIGIVIDAYESPQFCGLFVVSSVHELQLFLRVSKIKKEVVI